MDAREEAGRWLRRSDGLQMQHKVIDSFGFRLVSLTSVLGRMWERYCYVESNNRH